MVVVVTGGTGFVGAEIVRQLVAAGNEVRVLARSSRPLPPGATWRAGSVLDASSMPSVFQGADAVIHLVGIISELRDQTFERVHAIGTANTLHAARSAGVRRFVQMSALGTRANAVSHYHRSKWTAEETVRGSGLDWTILRPSLIYGPGDLFVNRFATMARWLPFLPVMGTGLHLLQPIPVELVAKAFVASLHERASCRRTLDLCGEERLSFIEILKILLSVLRLRRFLLRIPMPIARAQAVFLETIFPRLLGRPAPLNRDQLQMLQEDNVGDAAPANQLFHLEPPTFRDGIARFLKP